VVWKQELKPVEWVGSSLEDLRSFPEEVRDQVGFALYQAQRGGKHVSAKPLRGFKSAGVLEVVESHEGNAFRTVYTVKFRSAIYVLHAFQKKSKKGIKTPPEELNLIQRRLKKAAEHYEANYAQKDLHD
jgi:phage-related protein